MMEFFSDVWKERMPLKLSKNYMKDLQEDIILWILIIYLELDITGQLCLNMPMPMQENVMYVKEVTRKLSKATGPLQLVTISDPFE